jgi:Thioredoxin
MVEGQAVVPSATDPKADVLLTEDGFGIQIGKPFAPAAIEVFTEPQCTHCADFQFFFGTQISDYLDSGELVVTYRFLTFLDERADGYSHMVANAFFTRRRPESRCDSKRFPVFRRRDVLGDGHHARSTMGGADGRELRPARAGA